MKSNKKSVLVVDDHGIIRDGLTTLIEADSRFSIRGKCENCAEAIKALKQERFDLAIIDFNLSDGSGIELITRIKNQYPDCRSLLLTMHKEKKLHEAAKKAGASAVLLKDHTIDRLVREMTNLLEMPITNSLGIRLSKREEEVLRQLSDGLISKEIAALLGISVRTVETYRQRIHQKFGTKNTAELTRRAYISRKDHLS